MQTRGHRATVGRSERLCAVGVRELRVPLGRGRLVADQGPRGSGSFGNVTRHHTFAGYFKVALKTVKHNKATKHNKAAHRADLEREAMLHATLSHPNIVTLIGTAYEHENGPPFLVLEEGDLSLFEWQQQKKMNGKSVKMSSPSLAKDDAILRLEFMLQVSRALVYLHKCQVIHGDVHTGNMLVCSRNAGQGEVLKLCDFGRSVDLS